MGLKKDLIGVVVDLVEKLQTKKITSEQFQATVISLYEDNVSQFRPLVPVISTLLRNIGTDLRPATLAFLEIIVDLRKDTSFQELVATNTELKAASRIISLKIYMKAGFTRQEAMSLLLQDVANVDANIHDVMNRKSRSSSKSNE
ncbi:MAG: hypothetical protein NTX82_02930 [Candidatus Parcubacteria bacterium]|nr:hypothetical protein [Candidatus Parcubacteria bacterium]